MNETDRYPVVETSKGLRIHRPTCKKMNPERVVGDIVTHLHVSELATCCKPSYSEVVRQRAAAEDRPPLRLPKGALMEKVADVVAEVEGAEPKTAGAIARMIEERIGRKVSTGAVINGLRKLVRTGKAIEVAGHPVRFAGLDDNAARMV